MIELNEKKINNLYDEMSSLDVTDIFYELDNIRLNAEIGIRTALGKYLNGENLFPWDYKNIYKFNKGIEIMESDEEQNSNLEVTCLLNIASNYSDEEVLMLRKLYNENMDIMTGFEKSKQRVR